MTELYKAVYAYDTDKEDELSLKVGETVLVSNRENQDWWIAERVDNKKEFGLVPSNFLEKIPVGEAKIGALTAIVIQDYLAQSPDELSLQKNRIVTVLERDTEWWKGEISGKVGIFPADHVELVEESDEDSKGKKDGFKLAAYGVKQGGIGSILAGGFSLKRSSTTSSARSSVNERPISTDTPNVPSIPNKPRPPVTQSIESTQKIETDVTGSKNASSNSKAMVLHDYNPETDDEIKLMRGEYVIVLDQLDNDGWWKGTSESGGTGLFPSNFVQILEQDKPPQRPARARPATVKTESTASVPSNETNIAKPPPVPITTRPTSLLSNRDSQNSVKSSPPPRPITTPPRPTTTTPPVPTARRAQSIIAPAPVNVGHRRIPSIPLNSPDLPPVSPIQERPTRAFPRPTSIDGVNPNRSLSPDALQHMAKPPKLNFANKNPPPRVPGSAPTSRPTSTNTDIIPPVPKRSMPSVPETNVPPHFDQAPIRSPERKPHPNIALPSTPDEDPLDIKIRQLIKQETEKIRKEFEYKLEQERTERLQLQVELDKLKSDLNLQ